MYGLEVAKALHLPRDMIEAAFQMRRDLLGTTSVEEAQQTTWTSDLVRTKCSACGTECSQGLEVHHLEERSKSTNSRNLDGTALNHVRNLAVLCSDCHTKHHGGMLYVGAVEDTSEGPVRKVVDLSQYAYVPTQVVKGGRKQPFTDEQVTAMRTIVQDKPGLSAKLYCFQIRQTLELDISEGQFRTLQKNGKL
jgi:hypothetical protein